jgi:hypothetical protein
MSPLTHGSLEVRVSEFVIVSQSGDYNGCASSIEEARRIAPTCAGIIPQVEWEELCKKHFDPGYSDSDMIQYSIDARRKEALRLCATAHAS